LLSDSDAGSIAVDTAGRAHVFQVVVDEEPDLPPAFYDLNSNDIIENVTRWQCNTHVCDIAVDTVKLLKLLQSTPSSRCCNLYTGLDKCQTEARADRLGHPIYCHPDHHQSTSLLLPVRTLAVHYPFLRTLTARIYEQRRVAISKTNVQQVMNTGELSTFTNSGFQSQGLARQKPCNNKIHNRQQRSMPNH